MIKHFITLSFRNIWRKRFYSSANILGLAIGISACVVIYLIVSFELSFNKGFTDYERIYRISSSFGGTFTGINRGVPTAAPTFVRENFKGIEHTSHFQTYSAHVALPGLKEIDQQEKMAIVGPDFFEVFQNYTWLVGSPQESLSKPFQVVLTTQSAQQYFGDIPIEKILGSEIVYNDSLRVSVSGIVETLDFNTDIEMTDFISYKTIEASWLKDNFGSDNWSGVNSSSQLFIKLLPGITSEEIVSQLPLLSKKYKENSSWDAENNFSVQPFSKLHYDTTTGIFDYSRDPAHLPTLTTIGIVAILLLLIGAINFINLETAQAIKRAKEVGVRKVLGSQRGRLMLQFIMESTLITLLSIVLAIPLAELGLRFFDEFVPPGVELQVVPLLPFLAGILIFVGVLAGAYPAFVLSSFLPALALKNIASSNSSQSRTSFLRKSLIVFQFTIAQVLIIGTLVVGSQIHYMMTKDLGFQKDEVIYFSTPWWEKPEKTTQLKTELMKLPSIKDLSLSGSPPSANGWSSSTLTYKGKNGEQKINTYRKSGDPNYLPFYDMRLLAGRNVASSDTVRELVINETLVKQLGFENPSDVLGEIVEYGSAKIPVVGVVNDFHIQSMHKAIEPVMIGCEEKFFHCFNIRLLPEGKSSEGFKSDMVEIEKVFKKIYPDGTFNYYFLQETVKNFYQSEQRIAKLINTATLLAIFISCMGLFGLASYVTTQRTKEIGIRKVLGASVLQITFLLTHEFIVFVLVAFVIAAPLAWYVSAQWLTGFAYQTQLGLGIFIITMVGALVIALSTVSLQTLKAAHANPTDSLRSE